MMRTTLAILLVVAVLSPLAYGFYLPGVAPHDYQSDDEVDVKVVNLDSVKTQLPYEFYSLPFCRPEKIDEAAENLGEVLSGDQIETSLYDIRMKVIESCKVLCPPQVYTSDELEQFADKIDDEYRVNLLIDNFPVATKYYTEAGPADDTTEDYVEHYEKGFPLGFVGSEMQPGTVPGVKYLNNHVRFKVLYHEDAHAFDGYRVVGFEVEAFSVKHELETPYTGGPWKNLKLATCNPLRLVGRDLQPQPVSGTLTPSDKVVIFTYDVNWSKSDTKWASRWDVYFKMTDSKIHWFSIVNSIMIVLFLSGMVAVIMTRTLHRDLRRYNEMNEEDEQEETGWKLIHGDVFRPPVHGGFFSILVGTGVQIFAMSLIALVFAVLGFLSPANRGGLMTAVLLLFVFMAMVGGYFSTRFYKMFQLTEWKTNAFRTSIFFPGVVFSVFFVLNLFVWSAHSSQAVPFHTLLSLLVLWFGISMPLCYLGSFLGFKKPAIEHPCKINSLARLCPEQPWYNSPILSMLVGGVLPFAGVFIEIFFIMSSVWLHQFYYLFGFLFIVFIILIITCAEVTIVMCYFQLCNEDYHWWWRSFLTPGSSALYLFLYSIFYFTTKLQIIKFVSTVLYFGYMLLVCFAFFILTGTIGFISCFFFVRKIYGSIKID